MPEMYIGWSRASSPLAIGSKFIQWWDGGDVSHTYVKFYWQSVGGWLIYQASKGMVNFYNEDLFKEHNTIVEEIRVDLSDETYLNTQKFAYVNLGRKYSRLQLLGFVVARLCSELKKASPCLEKLLPEKNVFGNGHEQYVCTELVADILEECWGITINEDSELITPKMLRDMVHERMPF